MIALQLNTWQRNTLQEVSQAEKELLTFIDILYGRESQYTKNKGMAYISINQGIWREYPFNVKRLDTKLLEYIGEEDIYITPNTFMPRKKKDSIEEAQKMRRTSSNLWQLKFLYADLDILEKTNYSVDEALSKVWELVEEFIIPMPTMIVRSGRGLHLYWSIGDYVANDINKKFWSDLQNCIYERLKELGADPKVSKDLVRVLRVVGSKNKKNGATVKLEHADKEIIYTMQGIKDKYYKEELTRDIKEGYKPKESTYIKSKEVIKKPTTKPKAVKQNKGITRLFNPYTLHKARYEDLIKLLELRKYDIKGTRHHFIHLITYYYGMQSNESMEEIEAYINGINLELVEPMLPSEIAATVRGTYKYITRCKEDLEKVSRNASLLISLDSVSLNQGNIEPNINNYIDLDYRLYTNRYIIDLLDISIEEMGELKTLIDKEEKNNRKLERERKARRGADGLTKREQKKKDTNKSIQNLKTQGLTQKQVAESLAIGIATVKRHWNETL